jgi:hypothetical protein
LEMEERRGDEKGGEDSQLWIELYRTIPET